MKYIKLRALTASSADIEWLVATDAESTFPISWKYEHMRATPLYAFFL